MSEILGGLSAGFICGAISMSLLIAFVLLMYVSKGNGQ
jgi:hypothetical protein